MLHYKGIEIFTSETARYQKKPLADAVIEYIRELKIAARCFVTRGIAGSYESGEIASGRLEVLSLNLPIRIYIVLPARESERVLNGLSGMVGDGIVALHDLNIISHRTKNAFFPRQLLVRDVMSADPKSVSANTPLSDALRLLHSSIFSGLPVLDDRRRPVGVITQGDMIRKGGLPLRLGLLEETEDERREEILNLLASREVGEVMTTPAIMIGDDRTLDVAVELMLAKGVKRLPVIDRGGRLCGMLSRLDIFRTVMREAPDWNSFKAQKVDVEQLKYVGDVIRRDMHVVLPETPIGDVIRLIDENDIQRIAVVGTDDRLQGLISDRDLLRFFKVGQKSAWHLFARVKHPFKPEACGVGDLQACLTETTAGEVMTTSLVTVQEEMLIEKAIGLMIEKGLKRLPVVDGDGHFKGMISRDSLLRTGYGSKD